jgi:hypothetical protein
LRVNGRQQLDPARIRMQRLEWSRLQLPLQNYTYHWHVFALQTSAREIEPLEDLIRIVLDA